MEDLPIYGWRAYEYDPEGFGLRGGYYDAEPWRKATRTAECPYVTDEAKFYLSAIIAPEKDHFEIERARDHLSRNVCICGIYMRPTLDLLMNTYIPTRVRRYSSISYPMYVYAHCKGWGTIVEGDTGTRCEHVQVLSLHLINPKQQITFSSGFASLVKNDPSISNTIDLKIRQLLAEETRKQLIIAREMNKQEELKAIGSPANVSYQWWT